MPSLAAPAANAFFVECSLMASSILLLCAVVACGLLVWLAIREHRAALAERHGLLREAEDWLAESHLALAPDAFPIVTGRTANERQVRLELIADTMVTRRLPQLWLRVTVAQPAGATGPTIGALARPTGSEYYSAVHDMAAWMDPPKTGASMLMRGDGRATAAQAMRIRAAFRALFADGKVKEAVVSPHSCRIIYQVSQGERASHMVLRQARFSLHTVPLETIQSVLRLALALDTLVSEPAGSAQYEAA